MLINISNHPASTWSTQQIAVAKSLWGEVCDITLPHIDPQLSREEVVNRAKIDSQDFINRIQQYEEASAFHIMGESVYCFHLIRFIKEQGYTVVASTTTRSVEYNAEIKISRFNFVKFREY